MAIREANGHPARALAGGAPGFTLLEVLVALLVLALGMLGVAGMQVASLQSAQAAYARSRAVELAHDILERLRANPGGYAGSAVYDNVLTTDAATIPADPGCAGAAAGCSPPQLASMDVREWADNFVDVLGSADHRPALPGGVGRLARSGAGNTFTATVGWRERAWGNGQRALASREVAVTTRFD